MTGAHGFSVRLDSRTPLVFLFVIDATVVRGALLPAALALLGDRCWYLPRWLTWLPAIRRAREAREPPEARGNQPGLAVDSARCRAS